MKTLALAAALALAIPVVGSSQGAARETAPAPSQFAFGRALQASNASTFGGTVQPRAFRVVQADAQVYATGGGGAGNTVWTITDGTNTCTLTLACTTSAATGAYLLTVANGAGTGCNFAANVGVTSSVTTAGCTSTQPTLNLNVRIDWL